ncbi:cytochrome c oxidase subunit IV [Leishmania major strain Friedlin]|uniref:Cytochrome c oxidase subunit IV n=1 Tax=Leishmania major TaxID=5664 RepID=Q4QGM6_LEIMA|nr:cytochrome c oxidase subunit IV [Leishmania major strain Friedlin]CAG9570474.1 cytochrome_oxidase_subunit_IV_-_putative [Leishmania major strain Friedlin]CAJ02715.1 cytochrome c oxidase subunit IV [Leishmania major strain Friedlin]|eukprot:XP_001681672.1 cytochrome c oxidase subunit IV [Leishmania major strain Friedlin]
MLTRRAVSSAVGAAMVTSSSVSMQRRYDHDRWYGHALELDTHNYKFNGEPPSWMKTRAKTEEETSFAKSVLPHIDFASSYECLLFDADRLNTNLNRKEFGNEIKYRLEKQANTVARAQQLLRDKKAGTGPDAEKVENTLIARIFDEEHVQAEMKYVKCIRANELAEDNRLDILPGGSPNSLREKTRWNLNTELHPADRAEIGARLTAWLPEKYHIVYFDDFQTVAANDATARKEMLEIVESVQKEYTAEAKEGGYESDLKEAVAELMDDVDPTRTITMEAIKSCKDLQQLEDWSRQVHEYNGDDRIIAIYARAAEITKNVEHQALVRQMREWRKLATKNESKL